MWAEVLQSISSCEQLTDLYLSSNHIGEAGHYLAQSIKSWGDNAPLEELNIEWCSIPKQVWPELLQSVSSCEQLIALDLSGNTIGEAEHYLAQSITSWGDNPPLQQLNMYDCSIPEQVWAEVLQSLSSCKQLAGLNLSDNTIGEAGHFLAQSITSWGDNPPLQELYLCHCSIPEQVWPELLQSLSSCKQLTTLNLSNNTIGEAGQYLAQSITSWGDNPPLETLDVRGCSILEQVWPELLQSLSSCKQLTTLDLSGNTIGEAGHYLAPSITSWGDNPPLQRLDLYDCSIPEQVWPELLQSLSSFKHLSCLNLSRNTLIGCFFHFLPDANSGLMSLESLNLEETAISKADIQHLTQLIRANKLPHLEHLCLQKCCASGEEVLEQLIKACASHPNGESILDINLDYNDQNGVTPQTSHQENKQVHRIIIIIIYFPLKNTRTGVCFLTFTNVPVPFLLQVSVCSRVG